MFFHIINYITLCPYHSAMFFIEWFYLILRTLVSLNFCLRMAIDFGITGIYWAQIATWLWLTNIFFTVSKFINRKWQGKGDPWAELDKAAVLYLKSFKRGDRHEIISHMVLQEYLYFLQEDIMRLLISHTSSHSLNSYTQYKSPTVFIAETWWVQESDKKVRQIFSWARNKMLKMM